MALHQTGAGMQMPAEPSSLIENLTHEVQDLIQINDDCIGHLRQKISPALTPLAPMPPACPAEAKPCVSQGALAETLRKFARKLDANNNELRDLASRVEL